MFLSLLAKVFCVEHQFLIKGENKHERVKNKHLLNTLYKPKVCAEVKLAQGILDVLVTRFRHSGLFSLLSKVLCSATIRDENKLERE